MKATDLPGWVWLPGMRWESSESSGRVVEHDPPYFAPDADAEPDLADPATGGAMLALLGEQAWRGVGMYREPDGIRFYSHVAVPYGYRTDYHPTLARACLAVAASLGRWPGVRDV